MKFAPGAGPESMASCDDIRRAVAECGVAGRLHRVEVGRRLEVSSLLGGPAGAAGG